MLEAKRYIQKIKKSPLPMTIKEMENLFLSDRRSIESWHGKREFTVEAKKLLKRLIKKYFIS